MANHGLPTGETRPRPTVEDTSRRGAPRVGLPPSLKVIGKYLIPPLLTAFVGWTEVKAREAEQFALLDNYREYILEVEGQPTCACPEEEQ